MSKGGICVSQTSLVSIVVALKSILYMKNMIHVYENKYGVYILFGVPISFVTSLHESDIVWQILSGKPRFSQLALIYGVL
jgi:hypothetical protein